LKTWRSLSSLPERDRLFFGRLEARMKQPCLQKGDRVYFCSKFHSLVGAGLSRLLVGDKIDRRTRPLYLKRVGVAIALFAILAYVVYWHSYQARSHRTDVNMNSPTVSVSRLYLFLHSPLPII